jgi:internalin A
LTLSQTGVTDAGLKHLKELTELQTLSLWKTKVTDAGAKDLLKALPNCKISR